MRKELITQVLLIVILFYIGLHFYEQQIAVSEGLRPGSDNYDWAGTTFSITAIIATFFSAYIGYKALSVNKIGGGLLLFLSILTSCYVIMVLVSVPNETMQEILFYLKYYIVLGLWLTVYLFFALPKLMPQKEPS